MGEERIEKGNNYEEIDHGNSHFCGICRSGEGEARRSVCGRNGSPARNARACVDYDANRWDVAFALGLVSSRRVSHKAVISSDEMLWEFRGDNPVATVPEVDHRRSAKRSLGVQFGIPVSYRITPSLDLPYICTNCKS